MKAALALICIALVASGLAAQDLVRTGDWKVRGLMATDFPRVTPLAPNVYSVEQIDPTKRTVTVNNLIVIASGGVLWFLGRAHTGGDLEVYPPKEILEPYDAWTRAANNAFAALNRVYLERDGELK